MKKRLVLTFWFVLLVLALPLLHFAGRVREAGPLPERWLLPETIGVWEGDTIYYSLDAEVTRAFRSDDLLEPGICPVSGAGLDTVSPRERAFLPRDVDIDRRLYQGPSGLHRQVILLITGESREGIHRPDWCLVAQNVPIGPLFFLRVPDGEGAFDVGVYPIYAYGSTDRNRPVQYFVYWFEGGGARTPYHWSRILRAGLGRLWTGRAQRWAYFSIQMNVPRGMSDPHAFITEAVQWLLDGQRQAAEEMQVGETDEE